MNNAVIRFVCATLFLSFIALSALTLGCGKETPEAIVNRWLEEEPKPEKPPNGISTPQWEAQQKDRWTQWGQSGKTIPNVDGLLRNIYYGGDYERRLKVLMALRAIDSKESVPFLCAVLESKDEYSGIGQLAALALMDIGDNKCIPSLGKAAIGAQDPVVRYSASRALGHFKGKEVVMYLEEAAKDRDHSVREAAESSLRRIHGDTK